MRDDIVAGLKNAIVRGQSLEQAAQSFINSGYNPAEVKEAAQSLSYGAAQIVHPEAKQADLISRERQTRIPQIIPTQIPATIPSPSDSMPKKLSDVRMTQQITPLKGPKKNVVLIIFLIIILLLLIGGLIGIILFWEELLDEILKYLK